MAAAKIEVHGVRELRRALKEAEGRSVKELQQANKDAAEIVAAAARQRAPRGPHQGGGKVQPLVSAIKAQATSGRGVVAFGGSRAPHGPVVNFGGEIPRRGRTGATTHIPRREHIYEAIHDEREHVLREYERALARITHDL